MLLPKVTIAIKIKRTTIIFPIRSFWSLMSHPNSIGKIKSQWPA
jgi:hypothetical protein